MGHRPDSCCRPHRARHRAGVAEPIAIDEFRLARLRLHLSRRERSTRIVRFDAGEGLRLVDPREPLTRIASFDAIRPRPWRGEVKKRHYGFNLAITPRRLLPATCRSTRRR